MCCVQVIVHIVNIDHKRTFCFWKLCLLIPSCNIAHCTGTCELHSMPIMLLRSHSSWKWHSITKRPGKPFETKHVTELTAHWAGTARESIPQQLPLSLLFLLFPSHPCSSLSKLKYKLKHVKYPSSHLKHTNKIIHNQPLKGVSFCFQQSKEKF